MTPEDLVKALLATQDADARRTLLIPRPGDFYVAVVSLLKDEVDRTRLRDPQAALRVAEIAAEVAAFSGAPRCRALAAWARGNVLVHLGEYTKSLSLFEQAGEAFATKDTRTEAARLASNRAYVLQELGRYDEALQAAQAALNMMRRHPPSAFLASIWMVLGTLYYSLCRYEDALAAYAKSEQMFLTLGNVVEQARVTINKANVLESLDRFTEAIALLQQARATLVDHGCSLEVARADLNLGITFTRLGRYDEALEALDRAEKGFTALDNAMEAAVVELYRADLYAEFNLYDEVLQAPARSWQLFEERQMQWHAARATLHQAVARRRSGDVTQASELLAVARAAFVRIGDPIWTHLADLEQAALWYEAGEWAQAAFARTDGTAWSRLTSLKGTALWYEMGERTRALRLAAEVAAFLRDSGMPVRAAAANLLAAQCALALGQLVEATQHYQKALNVAGELNVPALFYRAHHGLGQVAEQEGRLEDAHEHFRQAIETVEGLRQRLGVEDLRVGFLDDKLNLYRDAVLLCLRLGHTEEAFAYVERAKSGALVELLVASLHPSPALPYEGKEYEGILARLNALREQLNWHYSKLEGRGGKERGQERPVPEVDVWERIEAIERETIRAWRQFQRVHPFYISLGRPDPPTPAVVRDLLREDEALLQYYVAGESVHVFVVRHNGLKAYLPLACTLSRVKDSVGALDATLRSAATSGGDYVTATLSPLSRQQLGWLYDDLLRPLAPFLEGASRLLIAPDGFLFQIPFHALHDGERYVVEHYEVVYTPSASALRLCQENRRRFAANAGRPLVVGYSRGGELPHVLREVEAVARVIPGARVFTDESATLACLQEHAGQGTFLHLATHAVFRRDNPLFSALQLAGGEWLRTMDLYTLRLNGALVTLSACETGRHHLRGGDLFGLSRGFFCAGAAALVVSLWPASDISTALLMEWFYTRLAEGASAAAALQGAQQDLRNFEEKRGGQRICPYAHPFHWAPFCLLGAPDVRLE